MTHTVSSLSQARPPSELQPLTLRWRRHSDLPWGMNSPHCVMVEEKLYIGGGGTYSDDRTVCPRPSEAVRPVRLWPHHFFQTLNFFFINRMCARARAINSSIKCHCQSISKRSYQLLYLRKTLSFKFPKRNSGKKSVVKRSFQPQWFARWIEVATLR